MIYTSINITMSFYNSQFTNWWKMVFMFYLFSFSFSCLLQVLIAGAVCTTEDVQLQSACTNKFIFVNLEGRVFANDSSEFPRKFFFFSISIFCHQFLLFQLSRSCDMLYSMERSETCLKPIWERMCNSGSQNR